MKAKEISEYVNLEIFRCRYCGKLLGNTSPNSLYIGSIVFRNNKTVTFDCTYCDKTILWRPNNENFKINK